ncbi:MAG: nucleotidyltransferase substrate binding protein [Candidatus Sumerlaeota bacterium]
MKAIQADAAAEGTECVSPRDCFRMAFRMGLVEVHETGWLKMVEDRNRTSHIYDEETAEAIYRSLQGYAELFAVLFIALQKREDQRKSEERL